MCNETTRELSCKGSDIQLDSVFDELSSFLPANHRDFDAFYLNSRSVSRLVANQFRLVRFRTILLGGSKLTHVHRDAFNGTHQHVQELYAFATNLSQIDGQPDSDLFAAIALLENLQRLVISGHNIRHIPHRAFKPRNATNTMDRLVDIELGTGSRATIERIDSQAFADLPALRSLSLAGNKIDYLSDGAFSFDEPSNKTLTVDLAGNSLNDKSFGSTGQAFMGINRPAKIYLGLNGCNKKLTVLNETVFEPFLNAHPLNMIDMGRGCPGLVCNDCRMQWIYRHHHQQQQQHRRHHHPRHYEQQIRNLKCIANGDDSNTGAANSRDDSFSNGDGGRTDETNNYSNNTNNSKSKCGSQPAPSSSSSSSPKPSSATSALPMDPKSLKSGAGHSAQANNKSLTIADNEDNDDNALDGDYDYGDPTGGSSVVGGGSGVEVDLCLTDECYEISTEMNRYLNQSLKPCDNFYDYACGGWQDKHLLDYLIQLLSNGGAEFDTFVKLRQQIDVNLNAILSSKTTTNANRVGAAADDDNDEDDDDDDDTVSSSSSTTTGDNKRMDVVKHIVNMYQLCKQTGDSRANIDSLRRVLRQMGGWPIIDGNDGGGAAASSSSTGSTDNIDSQQINMSYNWHKGLVYVLSYIRSDILINLDYVINENSVKQLKISHSSFILSLQTLVDINRKSAQKDVMAYGRYIHDVAVLMGAPNSFDKRNDHNRTINAVYDIIKFESDMAKISDKSTGKEFQLERPLNVLNCFIREINWTALLANITAGNHNIQFQPIISQMNAIVDIHYMLRLSQLLEKTDPIVIANYIGWRAIESLGFLALGPQFLEIQHKFHDSQQNERTKQLWRQCLQPLKKHVPYALTREYAARYLPPDERLRVSDIIGSVKQSFIGLIGDKQWLHNRHEFINKVETIKDNIGYPDWLFDDNQFREYHRNMTIVVNINNNNNKNYTSDGGNSSSIISNNRLVDYYIQLSTYGIRNYWQTIGKPVNKSTHWDQSPLSVGASYDIIENLITIPIGLLQSPFYDSKRPAYINYGSIGSFVGHEISHASMPRYDGDDRLRYPWDKTNINLFLEKAKCFVDQYSSYFDQSTDMNLDGMKTFEEDIGDIVGLKASFIAFNNLVKHSNTNNNNNNNISAKNDFNNVNNNYSNDIKLLPNFPNYTPQQLFFLSYAQKWCRYITPRQVRQKILRGVHSPEKYRVNGALSNFGQFAQAFGCPVGSAMNPQKRCEMW